MARIAKADREALAAEYEAIRGLQYVADELREAEAMRLKLERAPLRALAKQRVKHTEELAAERAICGELIEAFGQYMSQFGQALEAHGIPFGPAQKAASDRAFAALKSAGKDS